MHAQVPLIWFFGVATARYLPIFPVYVVGEEPHLQQFSLQVADLPVSLAHPEPDSPVEEFTRRYVTAQTRRRLHQPVFRARVIQAYTTRCAVCALAHASLLDAAHNGLALCKIHHAAAAGPDEVLRALTSRSEEAIELRQNSPFAGVLTEDERQASHAAFRDTWPADAA